MNPQEGTEKERMLRGELYKPVGDEELERDVARCQRLLREINATPAESPEGRAKLLAELLGSIGPQTEIKPPFLCDYGAHIYLGRETFINYECVILDTGRVEIGDRVQIGPGVHIYAADHPRDPAVRGTLYEFSRPVRVEDDVWIGGRTVLCPGVTVGAGSVIGAGSVVTKDVPPGVIAAGNPCRVIKPIEPEGS
ncbi:Acetyltransferase (isoleucine patch superfamily) [Rubrobacter radiotolerans]|uniref:Acetyltransferase (Isoleucine patch superfamily) n=1 Tax=Rubrobacter radiotolerans TaxID=42256 RepID=A0A023X5Y0_RUBRA|nr:sugar O-acetyltransferase [Rubrobacter radiotolerans]AHY47586.1 Acetyltransferase (isoleucine patch superfamily) [Rubrobacter radiotolerans]MDX5894991.1 sugar O-acetyltransferase [Rubrobacter radiotolerans]SMC07224.1 maltose O-acetyltransferase [Rubrobacter radiotolerans DSM 5868]